MNSLQDDDWVGKLIIVLLIIIRNWERLDRESERQAKAFDQLIMIQ